MSSVLVRVAVETRKAVVELEEQVAVAPDRRIEGAVKASVGRLLDRAFEQGFLRRGDCNNVKLDIRRL